MARRTAVLRKDLLWPKMGYRPNPAQEKVHASRKRHRANAAGRRTGKSFCGGRELMPLAMQAYHNRHLLRELGIRMEGWIVGPHYTDSEKEFRVFYNDCRRLRMPFDQPGTYYSKQDMSVSLWDGAFILHGKSGAKPETLVGEGLHFVLMGEAAKMKDSVWHRFIRPTLADFQGRSLWNTTPEGRNWFYTDIWLPGQDPSDPEWQSWRHPSWVNNHVYRTPTTQEAVNRLKAAIEAGYTDKRDLFHRFAKTVDTEIISLAVDLTSEAFAQEIECSFTDKVGRVFKYWNEEHHVQDVPYNPDWPLYIATDYGYVDPNVALFIQTGPFGEVRVIAEYYRTQRTREEFRDDVLKDERLGRLVQYARGLFPDPEDPAATITLSEGWKVPVMGGTGGLLQDRLDAIQQALRPRNAHLPYGHPERIPSLIFDRSCLNAQREMDAYSWPTRRKDSTKTRDAPLDRDNHVPEALGRFYAGHGDHGGVVVVGRGRATRRTA